MATHPETHVPPARMPVIVTWTSFKEADADILLKRLLTEAEEKIEMRKQHLARL